MIVPDVRVLRIADPLIPTRSPLMMCGFSLGGEIFRSTLVRRSLIIKMKSEGNREKPSQIVRGSVGYDTERWQANVRVDNVVPDRSFGIAKSNVETESAWPQN